MKYCEKCGKKLKEGFKFCDKCGTEVKEKEEKKKEKMVELKQAPKILPYPPKKKGKIIFLTIMNILLLASTITFLILWLIKPANKENKKKEKETVNDKFIGKWEQNVDYKSGNKIVQSIYESIEIKNDKTFKMTYYDRDNRYSTKKEYSGTYIIDGDEIIIKCVEDDEKKVDSLTLKNNKLCANYKCDNYLVKNNPNSKITIQTKNDNPDEINTITYEDYKRIKDNNDTAIIVVVQDGCHWCELFEDVVKKINENYITPVYYYKLDDNIGVVGTPTTIIINNGVEERVSGYKEYNSMKDILDDLNIE